MNTLILHLSLIKNIGPVTVTQVIDLLQKNNLVHQAYSMTSSGFHGLGIAFKTAEIIVQGLSDLALLEKELQAYEKYGISWATYKDTFYPEMLKHIYASPSVITWQGNIEYEKGMAVVGSRDATEYGKSTVNFFVPQLVEQGYTIISGGAYGIDACAHESALRSHGKTIVVLGSGLVRPYPAEHIRLFKTVVENGGAVVSIFSAMASAFPGNFPARNRVIAGLSQGCIVVQAALKSGARITADFALQQGRSVFAIPGPFNHPLSEGCNDLIKQGATMLTSFEDIAQEFGITQYRKPIMQNVVEPEDTPMQKKVVTPQKVSKKVLHPIAQLCATPQTFDDLLKAMPDKTASEIQDLLFDLSLEGQIEQDFSGMWKAL